MVPADNDSAVTLFSREAAEEVVAWMRVSTSTREEDLSVLMCALDSAPLIDACVQTEIAAAKMHTEIFRVDSVFVFVLKRFALDRCGAWFRESAFVLVRKVFTGQVPADNDAAARVVAAELLKSLAKNWKKLCPASVTRLLRSIANFATVKFADVPRQEIDMIAMSFLFLHVLTPAIVDPAKAGLIKTQGDLSVSTVRTLVQIGRHLQSFIAETYSKPNSSESKILYKMRDKIFEDAHSSKPEKEKKPARLSAGKKSGMRRSSSADGVPSDDSSEILWRLWEDYSLYKKSQKQGELLKVK